VAATNRDLRREVNSGHFRADLFYRLAVIQVRMPPLRDRLEDLPTLVRGLLSAIARERCIDAHIEPDQELIDSLCQHTWPGNVRELRNYLEQLLILRVPPPLAGVGASPALGRDASAAGAGQEPFEGLEVLPLRTAKSELLERFERHYVARLLEQTGGNVAEAARRAGVDRVTLFRTIRRHGLRGGDP
jgi:DNA-binding NtrC family response regulator